MSIPLINKQNRAGFTLVETLVAAGLAALILTVIMQLLFAGAKASREGATRVELQQKSLLISNRMIRDLRLASPDSVSTQVVNNGFALSIHRRVSDPSTVVWEPELVIYRTESSSLLRNQVPSPGSPDSPFEPAASDWDGLLAQAGEPSMSIDGVSDFLVTLEPQALVKFGFTLRADTKQLSVNRVVHLRH